MRKIILLMLALTLLLCACAPAAQPSETTTASDMAAFLRDGLAFDVSDLLQFLTNGQPPALEAAVMENLAALGIDPARVALQFDDPVPGSVKLPFANPSEADMARLDIAKLAGHIARQIAAEFEARGMVNAATTADTTATTSTTKASANPTTTTKGATTSATKNQTTRSGEKAWKDLVVGDRITLTADQIYSQDENVPGSFEDIMRSDIPLGMNINSKDDYVAIKLASPASGKDKNSLSVITLKRVSGNTYEVIRDKVISYEIGGMTYVAIVPLDTTANRHGTYDGVYEISFASDTKHSWLCTEGSVNEDVFKDWPTIYLY